jgi:hypothetical protein
MSIERGPGDVIIDESYLLGDIPEIVLRVKEEAYALLSVEEKLKAIDDELNALKAIGVYHQMIGAGKVDFDLRAGRVKMKKIRDESMPKRRHDEGTYKYLRHCTPLQVRKAIIVWYGRSTGIRKLRKEDKFLPEEVDYASVYLIHEFQDKYMYQQEKHEPRKNYHLHIEVLEELGRARIERKAVLKMNKRLLIAPRTGQLSLEIYKIS